MGARGSQVQGFSNRLNACFIILSSNEWKVITAITPPGASRSCASSIAFSRPPSSLLTSMRIAWNVRFAGCCASLRAAAGMLRAIMSASSSVVAMGFSARFLTIAFAMREA